MAKTLTQEQIDRIQTMARSHLTKAILRPARDQFHTIKQLLDANPNPDDWTLQDINEIRLAFLDGCSAATTATCSVVRRAYFKEIEGEEHDYEQYQFCVPCFFRNFCAGHPDNQVADGWHYNMVLLRDHLLSAQSKDDLDKQYILDRLAAMQASSDLQDLHDYVEGWVDN